MILLALLFPKRSGRRHILIGGSDVLFPVELFDPGCPSLAAEAKLPHVLINREIVINGGKISIPAIRERLMELGVEVKVRV